MRASTGLKIARAKGDTMQTVAAPKYSADPYFTDIIREMESAGSSAAAAELSRRRFIKLTGMTGAGLVLAYSLGVKSDRALAAGADETKNAVFNAYVRIAPSGEIILYNKAPEIGQGIKTSFPMILAEHMDADWADVRVEQAPINPTVYGRQSAGGSRSTPTGWEPLRRAGAAARAMLIAAAAKQWGVSESDCTAQNSTVLHTRTSRRTS